MKYLPISKQNRQQINHFISKHWLSTDMIIRGVRIDMTKVDGIIAMNGDDICEIISLDSMKEGGSYVFIVSV
ncbi:MULTISPECIES: hypothetical protein [Sedimentibacter]|uniref:Uncharacterized protein n=1 Tax=Sedimentibacter hydroxybenzoicus DSM 7310 TaxID=1123245 RepID=A0A974BLC5_SEDHY|nr:MULTISPECIES: hypothetical protein [Sedimentibacter]NYB75479.1 hypothetical protein [Sedimentibacter hydroxybenzoicus DSM 7310]